MHENTGMGKNWSDVCTESRTSPHAYTVDKDVCIPSTLPQGTTSHPGRVEMKIQDCVLKTIHPGLAKNIAPDGGPGSDIT